MNSLKASCIDDPLSLVELGSRGPVQLLLMKASDAWESGNRDGALGSCYAALRCANRINDPVCSALAQIHLADSCARCGCLEEGADWARRAVRHFTLLGSNHNAMVAYLLLARVERSSRNLDTAQTHYHQALELCRKLESKQKEAAHGKAGLYKQIGRQIQDAIADVSIRVMGQFDEAFRLDPIPILFQSDGPDRATIDHPRLVGYAATTGEFLIAGRTYNLHPLGETSEDTAELRADDLHFALLIHEDGWLNPASREGDYALVRREPRITQEGTGVLWTGENWVGGHFERDVATGEVRFVAPGAYIIGGEGEEVNGHGYVIALLKPVR